MNFAQKLKTTRKDKGLSQVKLAERAGYTDSTISDIEKSANYPSFVSLFAIAKALEMSPSELLEDVEV